MSHLRNARRCERALTGTAHLPVWKPEFYGVVALNLRVDLHAIDATSARRRGDGFHTQVAVSDMRQKLAELDGAAVPESDVARAVGELSAAVKRLGDDQARAHAIAAADRQRILKASQAALWRSSLALFLSAQLYALALGAIWFSLPAGFFDAGGVALTS